MTTADPEIGEAAELEALLPFHAAGTLTSGETERVERALARRPDLVRRLARVHRERTETIGLNKDLGVPSPRVMAMVLTAIAAETSAKEGPANVVTLASRRSGRPMA